MSLDRGPCMGAAASTPRRTGRPREHAAMASDRRRLLAAGVPLLLAARRAGAETFPSRPVTWIVPGAPGGVLDVGARLIAQKMAARLGQPVPIDNRPGAGNTIGAELASRAAPDGHTIFYGTSSSFSIGPLLHTNLRYDAERDFVPVHGVGAAANVLVTGRDRPWSDVAGLAAAARQRPEAISYASTGVGSGQQLAAELFARAIGGARLTHVPYANFAQALNDVATGRVDIMFDYVLSSLGQLRDGRLRALAVNAPERLAVLPEVPTLAQAGVPHAELLGWAGIYVPARTPPAAITRLADAVAVALRDPEVKQLFDSTGTVLWAHLDADGLRRVLAEDVPRMRALVERAGPARE